jgi:hypothetical protein
MKCYALKIGNCWPTDLPKLPGYGVGEGAYRRLSHSGPDPRLENIMTVWQDLLDANIDSWNTKFKSDERLRSRFNSFVAERTWLRYHPTSASFSMRSMQA